MATEIQKLVVKPLVWSAPRKPNKSIPYDHRIAETPFGRFVLTWKSWKAEPWQGVGFDELPWGGVWYQSWETPEEAMKDAEAAWKEKLHSALQASPGAEAAHIPRGDVDHHG